MLWIVALVSLALPLAVGPEADPPVPVLVELFTSEGCSSCPPADALLARLVEDPPVAGARIVALGLHVDYWDRLGWKDPFSLAAATRRQSWYAPVFDASSIYTPQMIVDGAEELIGSDAGAARRAIARAVRAELTPVAVRASSSADRPGVASVIVAIDAPAPRPVNEPVDVVVAITEDGLSSQVRRGENRGRTLRHTAVVRRIEVIGTLAGGLAAFEDRLEWPIAGDWRRSRLGLVAFLQGSESRRVYGIGTAELEIR